jgi:hypothetical protein
MHSGHSRHADGVAERISERNAELVAVCSAVTVDRAVAFCACGFSAGTRSDALPIEKWTRES